MIAFLVAAIASFVLGFPVRSALERFRIVDRPGARSSHVVPTVRGGGLGFVGILLCSLVIRGATEPMFYPLSVAAAALAFVSFVDDLRNVGVGPRLAVQSFAALVASSAIVAIDADGVVIAADGVVIAADGVMIAALFALAFVGCVGFTNAFNFMDGINGLAASHATIAGLATHVLARAASRDPSVTDVASVIAGVSAGFLPWNVPFARMFMGDVGSATLGFLLAAMVVFVVRDGGLGFVLPLTLVHAGFVLDTGITFGRRLARREKVWAAHREHFYQRLVRSGLSHVTVTTLYTTLTLAASIAACSIPTSSTQFAIGASVVVLAAWLALFAFAESRFRRVAPQSGRR